LAENNVSYRPYLQQKVYPNPLLLPLSVQHQAVEALPQQYKSDLASIFCQPVQNTVDKAWDPYLQGNPPSRFLTLSIKQPDGSYQKVDLFRIAAPMSGNTFIDGVPLVVAKREMKDNHPGLLEALEIFDQPNVIKNLRAHKTDFFHVKGMEFPFVYHEPQAAPAKHTSSSSHTGHRTQDKQDLQDKQDKHDRDKQFPW
jgi:hypothetical protein